MAKHQSFNSEFRAEAVDLVLLSSMTLLDVVYSLGINDGTPANLIFACHTEHLNRGTERS